MGESGKRRALVVASQTYGLRGCHNDAELVAELLKENGFDVWPIREATATRAGILGAYEDLIQATGAGDAVVVYYAGHGSMADAGRTGIDAELRCILPTDIAQTDPEDFRGILAAELSVLQWRLTLRTPNVTTILDCCHSGRMARDTDSERTRVRGWREDWPVAAVVRRSMAAQDEFLRLGVAYPESQWLDANPDAVRLVACSPHQKAHETLTPSGTWHGCFTDALVPILRDDPQITWQAAGELARHQVLAQIPVQRPEAEGPTDRIVFTLDERRRGRSYPVRYDPDSGQAWIDGAQVHGIRPGHEFLLTDIGRTPEPTGAANTRSVRVTHLARGAAILRAADGDEIPHGTVAHAQGNTYDLPVRVVGPAAETVRADLAEIPGILMLTGEPAGEIATVTATDAGYMLHDAAGRPLYTMPCAPHRAGIGRLRAHIEQLGACLRLRDLDADDLPGSIFLDVSVAGGQLTDGTVLHLGDTPRLIVAYLQGEQRYIYANVLDLGVAGRITVLNDAEPSGIQLIPGQRRPIGEMPNGQAQALPLFWPSGVPATEPRYETFLAIFSDTPQDLRGLAQDGIVVHRGAGGDISRELARLLRRGTRDTRPTPTPERPTRFTIRRVTFLLCPDSDGCSHQR